MVIKNKLTRSMMQQNILSVVHDFLSGGGGGVRWEERKKGG